MATPRRKTAPAPALVGAAQAGTTPWTGALRFDVYEENSGRHRWRLMTGDGHDLATSQRQLRHPRRGPARRRRERRLTP